MASNMIIDDQRATGNIQNYAPQPYQILPNPNVLNPVAQKSSLLPRKRSLLESELEERPGHFGRYACPYLQCRFSNYCLGFVTRADRNRHMLDCPFGDGSVPQHVSTDGQLPSAKFINKLVDDFTTEADFSSKLESLFISPAAGLPAFSSFNNIARPLANQICRPSTSSQIVESEQILPGHCDLTKSGALGRNSHGVSGRLPVQCSIERGALTDGGLGKLPEPTESSSALGNNNVIASSNGGTGKLPDHYYYPSNSGAIENNVLISSYGGRSGITLPAEHYRIESDAHEHNVVTGSYREIGYFPWHNALISSYGGITLPERYQIESGPLEDNMIMGSYRETGHCPENSYGGGSSGMTLPDHYHIESDALENNVIMGSYRDIGHCPENNVLISTSYGGGSSGMTLPDHYHIESDALENNVIMGSYRDIGHCSENNVLISTSYGGGGGFGTFPEHYHIESDALKDDVIMSSYNKEIGQHFPDHNVTGTVALENDATVKYHEEVGNLFEDYSINAPPDKDGVVMSFYRESREISDHFPPPKNSAIENNNNEIASSFREPGQLTVTGHYFSTERCALENHKTQSSLGNYLHEVTKINNSTLPSVEQGTSGFQQFAENDEFLDYNYYAEYFSDENMLLDDPFAWPYNS